MEQRYWASKSVASDVTSNKSCPMSWPARHSKLQKASDAFCPFFLLGHCLHTHVTNHMETSRSPPDPDFWTYYWSQPQPCTWLSRPGAGSVSCPGICPKQVPLPNNPQGAQWVHNHSTRIIKRTKKDQKQTFEVLTTDNRTCLAWSWSRWS